MQRDFGKEVRAHPQADFPVLEELLGVPQLSIDQRRALRAKIRNYAFGLARRNKDYKRLVGFQDFNLVELRWLLDVSGRQVPVRLICSDPEIGTILLICWHVKAPDLSSEIQRSLMNLACIAAIERMEEIDWN